MPRIDTHQGQAKGQTLIALGICIFLLFLSDANTSEKITNVDIEIVLAVDASGSVTKNELQLQLDGIAAAFRDTAVLDALSQGPYQSIAVAMLIWSDAGFPKYPTDWYIIHSASSAEVFAREVESYKNRHGALTSLGGGGTGLGDGLAFALKMLEDNNIKAVKKVVDVSGDGLETKPWNKGAIILPVARSIAMVNQTIVNGLAIETDINNLAEWYHANLISGAGSFVITASNFKDFTRAMRLKLIREFSPTAIGFLAPANTIIAKNYRTTTPFTPKRN